MTLEEAFKQAVVKRATKLFVDECMAAFDRGEFTRCSLDHCVEQAIMDVQAVTERFIAEQRGEAK